MGLLAVASHFQTANYLEAGFWGAVATGLAVVSIRRGGTARRKAAIAAAAFFLFGLSDVVEARTGAWYRPLGLLAWKAACLALIAAMVAGHLRERRTRRV